MLLSRLLISPLMLLTSTSSLLILVARRSIDSPVFRPRVVNIFAMRGVRGSLRVDEWKVQTWERWIWEELKRRV